MFPVLISIGSNIRQAAHVQWASQQLARLLENPRFSRKLWTKDIKGTEAWYMNRLVAGFSPMSDEELRSILKNLEAETKRNSSGVTIDLDLMQHGDLRFHERDWSRPYILQLINDVT